MSILRRWVIANAWSEALGLGLAAGLLALAIGADAPAPVTLAAAVLAGVVEGSIVGWAQARVLRDALPAVPGRSWLRLTIVGGVVAWVLGSLPAVLLTPAVESTAETTAPDVSLWVQLLLAVPLGLATGPILGGWQALALRGVVDRPVRWVWANALAWAVGMPVVFLGAGGLADVLTGIALVPAAVVTALAAGAVVGAIHGRWLVAFAHQTLGTTEPLERLAS